VSPEPGRAKELPRLRVSIASRGRRATLGLQRGILLDAFRAFETLWAPGQMLTLPHVWDPDDRRREDKDFGPDFPLYGAGQATLGEFAERRVGRARV
jgi:hypothetical protein